MSLELSRGPFQLFLLGSLLLDELELLLKFSRVVLFKGHAIKLSHTQFLCPVEGSLTRTWHLMAAGAACSGGVPASQTHLGRVASERSRESGTFLLLGISRKRLNLPLSTQALVTVAGTMEDALG